MAELNTMVVVLVLMKNRGGDVLRPMGRTVGRTTSGSLLGRRKKRPRLR